MQEGTTLRVMVVNRPHGKFYDFYSVSPEYFGYHHIYGCPSVRGREMVYKATGNYSGNSCMYMVISKFIHLQSEGAVLRFLSHMIERLRQDRIIKTLREENRKTFPVKTQNR
jgi:hypothetical protein